MSRVFAVLLLTVLPVHANSQSTGVLISTPISFDQGLGYKLPVIGLIGSVEYPMSNHLELDAEGGYYIAHKAISNDGHEWLIGAKSIIWTKRWVGITTSIDRDWLQTSVERKYSWLPAAGVVFRTSPLDLPSRIWIDYLFPAGGIAADGTESSRLQGIQFAWEASMSRRLRVTIGTATYRGLDQGPVYCYPSCRRTSYVTGNVSITIEVLVHGVGREEMQW